MIILYVVKRYNHWVVQLYSITALLLNTLNFHVVKPLSNVNLL